MIKEVEAGSSVPILRQRSMTKYGTPEAVAVGAAPLKVYHERQEAQRCAIHTVNNLLQDKMFSREDFDQICIQLSDSRWFNPHRSFWGTGNYDVNVIIAALHGKNLQVKWWDRRRGTSGIELEPLFGIIVNKQISWLCGLFKSRHWFALPKVGGIFHHCDSVAAQTNPFESPQHLFDFLQQIIEDWNGEILLITRTEALAASSDPPARDPAAMIGHTDTTPEVALVIRNPSPSSSSSSLKSAATPPLSESPFSSAAASESLLNVADSSPQLNFPPVCLDPLPSLASAPLLVADFPAVPQSPLESPAELIPPC